jgi:hypothetical protein
LFNLQAIFDTPGVYDIPSREREVSSFRNTSRTIGVFEVTRIVAARRPGLS